MTERCAACERGDRDTHTQHVQRGAMTDTPPDPLTEAEIAALRVLVLGVDDTRTVHLSAIKVRRLLATLDARPSGDEALRAAVRKYLDWQYRVPGAPRFPLMALRAALDAPVSPSPEYPTMQRAMDLAVSPSPDVEGLLRSLTAAVGNYQYYVSPRNGRGTCTICGAEGGISHDPTFACGKMQDAYDAAFAALRETPHA